MCLFMGCFGHHFLRQHKVAAGQCSHQHAAHSAHEQMLVCPTLMQNSLNMHSRLITLEMNPSGRAVAGARDEPPPVTPRASVF